MIISRTPFRISFFGGGSDHPEWYKHHNGKVLSTTFDKYCYLNVRKLSPFFDYKYRISYSELEIKNKREDIKHPAVREILNEYNINDGLEIHYNSDLPARSGIGSSSAFIVGLLNCIKAVEGGHSQKLQLGKEAIKIEREVLNEVVGCQDQVAAACGGLNIIEFKKNDEIIVKPVSISAGRKRELNDHLLLFFSGKTRISSSIEKQKISKMSKNSDILAAMQEYVDEALECLTGQDDIRDFGKLLNANWELKKKLTEEVSSSWIDDIYDTAIRNGAIGGKILGAGGGGFILFFAEPKNHNRVIHSLSQLKHVPIKLENTGSKIIYAGRI